MNLENLTSLENALWTAGLFVDEIHFDKLVRCRTQNDKGNQRSGWYRVFDGDMAMAVYGDWRTAERGIWMADNENLAPLDRDRYWRLVEQARREREAQHAAQWLDNAVRLMDLREECTHLTDGDVVCTYLQRRGIDRPHCSALMRHDKLPYWEWDEGDSRYVGDYAAMIGMVTAPDGKLVNLHRTYLSPDGGKAQVATPRKLMASAGTMSGASIKLGAPVPHKDGGLMLGIAEGIETALAASMLGRLPVWSCISAYGLRAFCPPPTVKHIYIFGDHDKSGVGQDAANDCAKRLAAQGFITRVLIPDSLGDWNDELISRRVTV